METQTAKLENVNKFSKYGLRRRPTYEEITNLLDENKKLGLPLPNRDATFFRNSPEGSFFDGIHQMEDIKDQQQRLLLRQMNDILMRQNIRTAGRTLHTERARLNAFRPPQIAEANMEVDAEGDPQPMPQRMQPTPPSSRLQQASQLNLEMEQRRNTAQKRREQIAINEAEQVKKFTKPTLQEQLLGLQPPRTEPESIPIFSSGDEALQTTKVKRKSLNATVPVSLNATVSASSNQAPQPMNTTSQPKRNEPETRVEPRGKAGRPKMFKHGTDRTDGTKRDTPEIVNVETMGKKTRQRMKTGKGDKRDGDDIPEETDRKAKRLNKNKEKQQRRLEARMTKETVNVENDSADDEAEEATRRKGSRVKQTIQKPKRPSEANNITIISETLKTARNRNVITAEEYKEFDEIFKEFLSVKGKAEKSKRTNKAKVIYKNLYPKLKKNYDVEMKK